MFKTADFREASERRHDAPSQTNRFSKSISNRSPVQKRLSIYNWNPGTRRGKEDAFEKQIAGRWHVITLQEASEYVDHDTLTGRFHVTHHGGCAILFNKQGHLLPNIDDKSIYIHDTRRDLPDEVMEGEQGWVMQGILSRASFRRPPLSGQETFTVLSLLVSHIYAKKIDVVAGDFNGTAWQCSNREITSVLSTKPLPTVHCQRRRTLHHCGNTVRFQTTEQTSVDSLSHQVQFVIGKCACTVPSPFLANHLVYVLTIKVAIMRHCSTWISSIGAALNHSMTSMTAEFSSNVLQRVHAGTKNDVFTKS